MKKIPENITLIFKAIFPLSIVIILFVILTKIGISQISTVRQQISEKRSEQLVLSEKVDMLSTVAVTGTQDSNVAVNSIPDTNPALLTMSQLKTLAANSDLVLRSLKSTGLSEGSDAISSVEISFTVVGDRTNLESFLSSINSFAPITILDSAKISESGGGLIAKITVKSFWSPFPTKLPDSIEEFKDLTPEDKQILANLSALTQPTVTSLPPPNINASEDPFAK